MRGRVFTMSHLYTLTIALIAALLLFSARGAYAEEQDIAVQSSDEKEGLPFEARASLAVRGQFAGMFGVIPTILGGVAAFDFGRWFRGEVEVSGNTLESDHFQGHLSGGVAIPYYTAGDDDSGVFTGHIPLLAGVGLYRSSWEGGDGYFDNVDWVTAAVTTRMDFTWWTTEHVGIDLQLGANVLFRLADRGSEYDAAEYEEAEPRFALVQYFVSLGASFR